MTKEKVNSIGEEIVIAYFISYYHPDQITIDNVTYSMQKLFYLANAFGTFDIIDYIYNEDVRKLRVNIAIWFEGYLTGQQMDKFIDNLIKYMKKLIHLTNKSLKDLKTSYGLT